MFWPQKHEYIHQNYNSVVNIKRIITILSNVVAILIAILELKRIKLSAKICFGQIGFLDPKNIGVDTKITTLRQIINELLSFLSVSGILAAILDFVIEI